MAIRVSRRKSGGKNVRVKTKRGSLNISIDKGGVEVSGIHRGRRGSTSFDAGINRKTKKIRFSGFKRNKYGV